MAHPVARAAGRSLAATLLTFVLVPVIVVLVFGLPALAIVLWLIVAYFAHVSGRSRRP